MSETLSNKRKPRKIKDAAPVIEAPATASVANELPPAPKMLTQDEIHKMRLYEVEARAARAEAETSRIRKKYILSLLDTKHLIEKEERRFDKSIESAREWAKKHELLIAQISMRLNIDLKECGFDPETGVVVVPEKSAKGK